MSALRNRCFYAGVWDLVLIFHMGQSSQESTSWNLWKTAFKTMKTVFHKIYLVNSWALSPICSINWLCFMTNGSSSWYLQKMLPKTNMNYPLIRTLKYVYACLSVGKKSSFFLEDFAFLLNGRSLNDDRSSTQ